MKRSGPERTCAGCRRRRPKPALIRFGRTGSGLVVDPEGRLGGRGGYACRDAGCIERALRRGGLARALRAAISPEEAERLRQQAVEYL